VSYTLSQLPDLEHKIQYLEPGPDDVIVTVATDGAALYPRSARSRRVRWHLSLAPTSVSRVGWPRRCGQSESRRPSPSADVALDARGTRHDG